MTALLSPICHFFSSSIGKKWIVALTGLILVLFLIGHLAGNLLIYLGPQALNTYGHQLQSLGAGLWVARIILLVAIALHFVTTVQLTRINRMAKGQRYAINGHRRTTAGARYMIVSGTTILLFVIYHLMHFTIRVGNDFQSYRYMLDGTEVHDVYRMVIQGFTSVPVSFFYIIAMAFLAWHLLHGIGSLFQTLGLSNNRTRPVFEFASKAIALILFLGNISIPISVMIGVLQYQS